MAAGILHLGALERPHLPHGAPVLRAAGVLRGRVLQRCSAVFLLFRRQLPRSLCPALHHGGALYFYGLLSPPEDQPVPPVPLRCGTGQRTDAQTQHHCGLGRVFAGGSGPSHPGEKSFGHPPLSQLFSAGIRCCAAAVSALFCPERHLHRFHRHLFPVQFSVCGRRRRFFHPQGRGQLPVLRVGVPQLGPRRAVVPAKNGGALFLGCISALSSALGRVLRHERQRIRLLPHLHASLLCAPVGGVPARGPL